MNKPNLLRKLTITGVAGVIGAMLNSPNARADSLTYTPPIIQESPRGIITTGTLTARDTASDGFDETVNVDGVFWDFEISVKVQSWVNPGGLGGAGVTELELSGVHVFGPDQGPFIFDNPNDPLPPDQTILPGPISIPYGSGQSRLMVIWNRDQHLTNGLPHYDDYGMIWNPEAVSIIGVPVESRLRGPATVAAYHRSDLVAVQLFDSNRNIRLAGLSTECLEDSSVNSTVSFISTGPEQGFLRFNIGDIAVVDNRGGLSCGIDSKYQDDPILSAQWTVSDLEFLGTTSDGRFRFGGGTVTLTDPNEQFSFTGTFPEYIIDDTSDVNPLSSFALFDNITITDVGNDAENPSIFLQDFANENLLGIGVEESIFDNLLGNDFSFITSTNLATETNGFSQSALNMPITAIIAPNGQPVPEPSSLLGLGTLAFLGITSTFWGKTKC